MAISREKKEQIVAGYVELLSKSQAIVFTDFRGLTVSSVTQLRNDLRQIGGVFQIVKNTLFERALIEAGIPVPAEQLKGAVAVGYCLEEAPPVAKKLMDFVRESGDRLAIKGAIVGDSYLDADGVKGLAELPPREVLLAQLLGTVQGPASSLVSTIVAPMRDLVQVLHARSEQGNQEAA